MDKLSKATDPWIGVELDGRYQLLQKLGEGGMGVVYKAKHILIEKPVAIKILRSEFARKKDLLSRFHREARSASQIRNAHIVDVTDFGNTPDDSSYFVMEYLEGVDLASLLNKGPVPYEKTLVIVGQLCSALSAAHNKGIIHRDLKPENIFLCPQDEFEDFVKILDFGIAKITEGELGQRLTKPGMIFGTPEYMAPEQAEGGIDLDQRVDIYALGVLFFEMLTGKVPFYDDSFMEVLRQQVVSPVPALGILSGSIPKEIEAIIRKALAKQPEDRFQTMREFWNTLQKADPNATSSPYIHVDNPEGKGRPPAKRTSAKASSAKHDQQKKEHMSTKQKLPSKPSAKQMSDQKNLPSRSKNRVEEGLKRKPSAYAPPQKGRSRPATKTPSPTLIKNASTGSFAKNPLKPPLLKPAFSSGAYALPKGDSISNNAAKQQSASGTYRAQEAPAIKSFPTGGYRVSGSAKPVSGLKKSSLPSGGYRVPKPQNPSAPPPMKGGGDRSRNASLSNPSGSGGAVFQREDPAPLPATIDPDSTLLLNNPPKTSLREPNSFASKQDNEISHTFLDDDEDAPTQLAPMPVLHMLEETVEVGDLKNAPVPLSNSLEMTKEQSSAILEVSDIPTRIADSPSLSSKPLETQIQEAETQISSFLEPDLIAPPVPPIKPLSGSKKPLQATEDILQQEEQQETKIAASPIPVAPVSAPRSSASLSTVPEDDDPKPTTPFLGVPPPAFSAPPEVQAQEQSVPAAPSIALAETSPPSRKGRIFLAAFLGTLVLGSLFLGIYYFYFLPSQQNAAVADITSTTAETSPEKKNVLPSSVNSLPASTTANPIDIPTTNSTELIEIPPPIEEIVLEEEEFQVTVPVKPSAAKIYRGREFLGKDKPIILRGKEGEQVRLTLKAKGYKPQTILVTLGKTKTTRKVALIKNVVKPTPKKKDDDCNGTIINPFSGC